MEATLEILMDLVCRAIHSILVELAQESHEPCYTEEDVQYKVEKAGLDNVDTSSQTSAEECRTHCRYVTIDIFSKFINVD